MQLLSWSKSCLSESPPRHAAAKFGFRTSFKSWALLLKLTPSRRQLLTSPEVQACYRNVEGLVSIPFLVVGYRVMSQCQYLFRSFPRIP